jgi:hypothetical protein
VGYNSSPRGAKLRSAESAQIRFNFGNPLGYSLVRVKVPFPVHPWVVPVKFHVPVIVLLFTVPCRTRVLPLGVPDVIVNWKAPVILPLKLPLRTKDPVCDPPEVKHGVDVVKLRFVPVTEVPLLWLKVVVNVKSCVPVSVAVQLPVTVFELLELPPPQARRIRPTTITIAIPNCFIETPSSVQTLSALKSRARCAQRRETPLWQGYGIELSLQENAELTNSAAKKPPSH